jgi:hypothetical protein
MDYELAWNEMKAWLDKDVSTMLEQKKMVSGRAYYVIQSKIHGMKIAQKYMTDYEKRFIKKEKIRSEN